ncbi:hypothetical protein HWV62_25926 [Athelia sp. TMB]|nr:hypothetical protein HWV62_25926 [Athelia sp. TMB]
MSDSNPTDSHDGCADAEKREPIIPVRSDLWYEDGSVVLQAENTQFKVYRGILAESSSVFNDMFSFPQPLLPDIEHIEGCPVVHLSDSAQEVEYILRALFRREYLGHRVELPWGVFSAWLCLGQKYDIEQLYTEARNRLFEEIPATLAAYDAAEAWSVIEEPKSYMEIAILARKTGNLSVLPFSLYECCKRHSTEEILGGVKIDKNQIISLTLEDKLLCLASYQRIREVQGHTTYGWLDFSTATATGCRNPAHCTAIIYKFYYDCFPPSRDAIYALAEWEDCDLCGACAEVAKERQQRGRIKFWDQLPSIFNLPSWDEMLKERGGL